MSLTSVLYCSVCSFPPEFCEFGGTHKRCREWLEKAHPDQYRKLYSADAAVEQVSSISLERQEEIDRKVQKQVAKEEAKAERELAKKKQSKIIIKRIERNKRKHVIVISGLEQVEPDLKKQAKAFASRFATGASVTKAADGRDEIAIQGDVGDEVETIIQALLKKRGLEDIKIEQVQDKKKSVEKASAPA